MIMVSIPTAPRPRKAPIMPRPKATIRYRSGRSNRGLILTERDIAMLTAIHRWNALTTAGVTAAIGAGTEAEPAVDARLAKLSKALPEPMVERRRYGRYGADWTGWTITSIGARFASTPWAFKGTPHPERAEHAALAGAVGTALERAGVVVLSEREHGTGFQASGERITVTPASPYWTSGGAKVEQTPDLVVPCGPSGEGKIVVEIERRKSRPLGDYVRKIEAYRNDVSVCAVWYFCTEQSIENRVDEAADRVLGTADYPLRIIGMDGHPPMETAATILESRGALWEDLRAYGAVRAAA